MHNQLINRTAIIDDIRRLSKIRNVRKKIVNTLLVLIAFFSPWGSGLQQITSLDLSKIFVGLMILLIIYWMFSVKNRTRVFPKIYNYFIILVAVHTFETYLIIFPNLLRFGYVGEFYAQDGFVKVQEAGGMQLARYFLFVMLAYAFSSLIRSDKHIRAISIAYGAGLTAVMLLGGYKIIVGSGLETRYAGGFLNPNSFGITGVMVIFLNMFQLSKKSVKKRVKALSFIFILIGIVCIFLSGSRGAMTGTIFGFLTMIRYTPTPKKKLLVVIILSFVIITVFLIIPQDIQETVKMRISLKRIKEDRGAKRIDIWANYIKRFPRYALIGVGIGRSRSLIDDYWETNRSTTNNHYLNVWVSFGSFGLLLFIIGLQKLWKRLLYCYRLSNRDFQSRVILSLFAAWITLIFFIDVEGLRDWSIFLGIIANYSYRKI